MSTESEIVRRAREGELDAFTELVERYEERIRRYVVTMVADLDVAGDLVQECFQRAQESLAGLRDEERFDSWLFAIAVNLCRAHLRAQTGKASAASLEALGAEVVERRRGALTSVLRRESAELLALAIDRLPILLREAFVLHHVEGLGYAQMAEIAGASEGTLQVRAHRARGLLRQQLGSVVDTYWAERGKENEG